MHRRDFIRTGSLMAMASAFPALSCVRQEHIPVIDTHQHLWDLGEFPLTWVKAPIDRDFLPVDYREAAEGLNIVRSIYMEVGVPPAYRRKEAEYAMGLCRDPVNTTAGAVIKADPSEGGFRQFIDSFEGDPFLKGIRHNPGMDGKSPLKEELDNIRYLGESGLSMDLNPPARSLRQVLRVLDSCPGVPFILDHCGNPDPVAFIPAGRLENVIKREPLHDRDQWFRDIKMIAERPNVICKISGIVDNVGVYPLKADDLAPIVDHCMEAFGEDRVMFGGDWPVCLRNMSLAGWLGLLKEIVAGRTQEQRRKLFHDNAFIFYGLAG